MPAQPDPDLALRLAKTVADIYSDAATQMLARVAKRLATGIDSPGWAEAKLLEVVLLRNDARAIIAELEREAPKAVRKVIVEAYAAGSRAAKAELGATVASRVNERAITALANETLQRVAGTHDGILRSADDIYRTVVAETSAPGVLTGTATRRQAAQAALDRFTTLGISGFRDRAGRNWQLESYAEMATRTSVSRAQVAGHIDRYVENGQDLVIVSDAPQECKACRPWEGKILSITGMSSGYPTVDQAQAAGLHHPNCRHSLGAYVPGLTRPMTHTADPKGDKLRQEQRHLERMVRQWKRQQAMALTPERERVAAAKVREWQGRLKSHVDGNDLKRLRYREQITGAI